MVQACVPSPPLLSNGGQRGIHSSQSTDLKHHRQSDQHSAGEARRPGAWCPSCHHMQNLMLQPDAHVACPRCGDPMWADQAQHREPLHFRQAIANSDDTRCASTTVPSPRATLLPASR